MARNATVGSLVRFEARPGEEQDVVDLLRDGLSLVQKESDGVRWFGLRFGPSSFGIFDAFPDDGGRRAHLDGELAEALQKSVGTLIEDPAFDEVDVLVERPPV